MLRDVLVEQHTSTSIPILGGQFPDQCLEEETNTINRKATFGYKIGL
jgi:hypothetical protein